MSKLILDYPHETDIKRTFKFLYKRQLASDRDAKWQAARKVKKIERKKKRFPDSDSLDMVQGIWSDETETQLVYGLWHNSLGTRIAKSLIRDYRHGHRLRQTAMFGQKLIVDLDYDQYMKPYETRLLGE